MGADTWRLLSRVAPDALDIDDLDPLATAAYLIGHDEEGLRPLGWEPTQACASEGAGHRAARTSG